MTAAQARRTAGFGAVVICRTLLYTVGWLALFAVVPALLFGDATVVGSGSMRPALQPGDVVLLRPPQMPVDDGDVLTFWQGERAVTHRVTGVDDQGHYRTKGDANPVPDSTPVEPETVIGSGYLVVPMIGRIVVWAEHGDALPVAAVLAALVVLAWGSDARLAGLHASVSRSSRPGRAGCSRPPPFATEPGVAGGYAPGVLGRLDGRIHPALIAVTAVVIVVTALGAMTLRSLAATTVTTENAGSSWSTDALTDVTGITATEECDLLDLGHGVALEWEPSDSGFADGYEVERSEDGGESFASIASLDEVSADGYEDDDVDEETAYTYRVRTVDADGDTSDGTTVDIETTTC